MPWIPELFTAPALEQLREKQRQDAVESVPFFDGLVAGDTDALVNSFAGDPELYDPIRGRITGARAFREFVAEMSGWLARRNASVEDVSRVILDGHGFEEVVLHLEGDAGRVGLPFGIVADHPSGGYLDELRLYYSSWPLTGRHANRPALLQPGRGLVASDVVGEYQRALAAGDVDAIVAVFEPGGYAREPAGGRFVHRGPDDLRAFYEEMFSNGGGIPLERCAVIDDGQACAVEYNVVRWGATELRPQAGMTVYVRGPSGRLAAVRIYDDADPALLSRG
jgi:hypothetical protein